MAEVDKALSRGDAPFGAALVDSAGQVLVLASNTSRSTGDPTAHAEINLLRQASSKLGTRKFGDYGVVTNAASCAMCLSAMIMAGVKSYYYGAPPEPDADPPTTPEELSGISRLKMSITSGILAEECERQILRDQKRRQVRR